MSGVEKINITFDNEGIKKFNNFTNQSLTHHPLHQVLYK